MIPDFSPCVYFQPINISNLPATYQDLSEDTEINEPLIVIETTDQNPADTVTCSRVSISSPDTTDPIDQDLFRVTQTYSGSNGMLRSICTITGPPFLWQVKFY